MDLAASPDWFNHVRLVLEDSFDRLITSDNDSVMLERDGTSLDLSRACVMVHPDLEIVTEAVVI